MTGARLAGGAVALIALLGAAIAGRVPPGILVLGVLLGGLASLTAVGLVLVWRANRFLNLSHSAMGLMAGVLYVRLASSGGWSLWSAFAVALTAGALLGLVVGGVCGLALHRSPRPVVMIASLGLAYVIGAAQIALGLSGGTASTRVSMPWRFELFPVVFDGLHVLAAIVIPLSLAAVGLFLYGSRWGIAVRALAAGPDRARSLGVPYRRAVLLAWALVGTLAAVGGMFTVPLSGLTLGAGPGASVLLLPLAAAVVGRMRSLTLTVAASLWLGAAYQVALWTTDRAAVADLVLLAVVASSVVGLRRRRIGSRGGPDADRGSFRVPRPTGRPAMQLTTVVVAAIVVGAIVHLGGPSIAQRIGTVTVFALVAVAVALVSSMTGRLSAGHWALCGVGAAVASVAPRELAIAMPLSAICTAAASIVMGLPSLRGSRLGYTATTLGVAVAGGSTIVLVQPLRRTLPIGLPTLAGMPLSMPWLTTVGVAATAAALLGARLLRTSRGGTAMIALRDHEALARVQGVRPGVARLIVYGMSGATAGVAGCLYLYNQQVVHPEAFTAERSLIVLAMAAVGGLGSVPAAAAGAVALSSTSLLLTGAWTLLGTGAGLVLVALVLPSGLAGAAARVLETLPGRGPADLGSASDRSVAGVSR